MDAKRVDSLLDQPFHLGGYFSGAFQHRARLCARSQASLGGVTPVRKALGEEPHTLFLRLSRYVRAGQAQHGQVQVPGRLYDSGGNLGIDLGLVVKRSVRLEELDLDSQRGCPGRQLLHLVKDQRVRGLPIYGLLTPAEVGPVRVPRMGSHYHPLLFCGLQGCLDFLRSAGMGTTAHAGRGHAFQKLQVPRATFTQIRVQIHSQFHGKVLVEFV